MVNDKSDSAVITTLLPQLPVLQLRWLKWIRQTFFMAEMTTSVQRRAEVWLLGCMHPYQILLSSRVWSTLLLDICCLWRHNMTSYSILQIKVLAKFVGTTCILFYTHSPYSLLYNASLFFFWSSFWNHCLAVLDLGAGVDKPFNGFIVQHRQDMQSIGMSMGWTLEDNMVDGLFFCATLTGAEEAIPHLYKQERKRPTPVRRRLSRTHVLRHYD